MSYLFVGQPLLSPLRLLSFLYSPICVCSDVCTKYQEAAKIVNITLEGLLGQCIPGATILDICEFGHSIMEAQATKLYTKKVNGKLVDRGVAFPICISVNDVVCNHSPLPTEETVRNRLVICFMSCVVSSILSSL